ncbi:hypothetical protein TPB0596_12090 [Tsukamurella pulmonis]|uniref:hypothetical protein n=1 Tax=Tsukamurella pulmonis TaxID=47312 RepID=UPI001EDE9FBB|nr:hypothetical protein [Tsukamurella pulmonis]BDD81446.1 hypothetical protein TPB0596_12090 [Tsukamurella pulmonis]
MTNTQGNVQESIWRDRQFRGLTRSAQCTYIQLLCQKELDRAGILPYQPTKWAKGCDAMSLGELESDIVELQHARFVYLDDETDELLVRTYLRKESAKHPNHLKAGFRAAKAVASRMLRAVLVAELKLIGTADAKAVAGEIDPGEDHDPDATPMPSGSQPDGIDMASRSDMPSRCHPDPTGMGMGKGTNGTLGSYSSSQTTTNARENEIQSSSTGLFSDGTPPPPDPGPDPWALATDGANARHLQAVPAPETITIDAQPAPRTKPRAGSAALTVVRHVLGADLGRELTNALAVHVGRKYAEGVPDAAIRQGLVDYRDDPSPAKNPGWLPNKIGDAALRAKAQPTDPQRPARPSKLRLMAELAAEERAREALETRNHQEELT